MYHITTPSQALELSRQEALSRGCDPKTTKYWWSRVVSTDGTQAALELGDDYSGPLETVNELPEGFIT